MIKSSCFGLGACERRKGGPAFSREISACLFVLPPRLLCWHRDVCVQALPPCSHFSVCWGDFCRHPSLLATGPRSGSVLPFLLLRRIDLEAPVPSRTYCIVKWYTVGHGLAQCLAQQCHLLAFLLAFGDICGLKFFSEANGLATVPNLMFLFSLLWIILAFVDSRCSGL